MAAMENRSERSESRPQERLCPVYRLDRVRLPLGVPAGTALRQNELAILSFLGTRPRLICPGVANDDASQFWRVPRHPQASRREGLEAAAADWNLTKLDDLRYSQ